MISRALNLVLWSALAVTFVGCSSNPIDVGELDSPELIETYPSRGLQSMLQDSSGFWALKRGWLYRILPEKPDSNGNIVHYAPSASSFEGGQLFHDRKGRASLICSSGISRLLPDGTILSVNRFPATSAHRGAYCITADSLCYFLTGDTDSFSVWCWDGESAEVVLSDDVNLAPVDSPWVSIAASDTVVALAYARTENIDQVLLYANGVYVTGRHWDDRDVGGWGTVGMYFVSGDLMVLRHSEYSWTDGSVHRLRRDDDWDEHRHTSEYRYCGDQVIVPRSAYEVWFRNESGYGILTDGTCIWHDWRSSWINRFDIFCTGPDNTMTFFDEATQTFVFAD